MDKVKVLKITDLKEGKDEDYTSAQIDILQEVTAIDEDAVIDHYGNAFVVEIEDVVDDNVIREAVNAGAREIEMYRTAFNEEIADDITERVDGQWAGFSEFEFAYFRDKGDARLCEELLGDQD